MPGKYRRAVITPRGRFHSQMAAAKYYGIEVAVVRYRCIRGEQQRRNNEPITRQGNDWRSWRYEIEIPETPRLDTRVRAVITPLGKFPSIVSAHMAHRVSASTIIYRIKQGMPGYRYADGLSV